MYISLQFFEKKDVPDITTAEDLFKSITGFEEVDVNLLEGVHTVYNSLSSRFEIAPDDNRNVSYPFEYCWNKSNETKKGKSNNSGDDDDDDFDEMWKHAKPNQIIDASANFGNEVETFKTNVDFDVNSDIIVDTNVNFGNVIDVALTKNDVDIGGSSIDKKS